MRTGPPTSLPQDGVCFMEAIQQRIARFHLMMGHLRMIYRVACHVAADRYCESEMRAQRCDQKHAPLTKKEGHSEQRCYCKPLQHYTVANLGQLSNQVILGTHYSMVLRGDEITIWLPRQLTKDKSMPLSVHLTTLQIKRPKSQRVDLGRPRTM